MAACGVVPTFDVAEDRHPGLCLRSEPPARQQFAFERGKEALAHGVVIGIAYRSHGRADAGLMTATTERQSRILGGFKRSSQHDRSTWTRIVPCSISSRTSRRCAPMPQAASWTGSARGALPEAGRLQGMILAISPRNAILVLDPDR